MKVSAEIVMQSLLARKMKISFVESCTGGMLASSLISVSGASGVIEESFVTYSNRAKHQLVGVKNSTLEKHGAISAKTAKQMAKGGAKVSGSDICVSVTGVAGPNEEEGKPVGLVYIGVYFNDEAKAYECNFEGTRDQIRRQTVKKAFEIILNTIN